MNTTNGKYNAEGGPLIWVIDSEQWPRAALRAELLERGYQAVGFVWLSDALEILRSGFPEARLSAVVLELRGQSVDRKILREFAGFGIPTILLLGAVELKQPHLLEFRWAALLRRPVTIGEIADQVEKILHGTGF